MGKQGTSEPISQAARELRAVVYLRVATDRQGESQAAIGHQLDGCERIAAKYGLLVVRQYIDIGQPARLERQIGLRRLLDDLSQKQDVGFVIVWDYSRLARSMEQLDEVTRRIHACGAEIATITGVEAADRFRGAMADAEQANQSNREEG